MRNVAGIDAVEAKAEFSALRDRFERGEETIITRKGQAVAKPVRFEREPEVEDRCAAIERIANC